MHIKKALELATARLVGVAQRPRFEAEILLAAFLGQERIWLHAHPQKRLEDPDGYFGLIGRREAHEPVEYITNRVSFYSMEFYIAPGALIPRPETELLIDEVLKRLDPAKEYMIAEVGTGSGIISIVLALHLPKSRFIATDISPRAIEIAQINARKYHVKDQITFVHTNLLDGIREPIDIVISNPPYIAADYKIPKSLEYEPQEALFGGPCGDELLRSIIDEAPRRGAKLLACEMGYDQKAPLEAYLREKGVANFHFYQDLAGYDRGFVVEY